MMKTLVTTIILFISCSASAATMQYSLCTLNDGKTMADAQAWANDWRKLVKSENLDYALRLLIPHASTETAGQFYIEGSTTSLSSYAVAWEWWYSDEAAAKSTAQLVSVAQCGANSIYVTAD